MGGCNDRGLLGEGGQIVGEDSSVGEAEVVRLAEDDMVEHPDSEDFRSCRQPVGAFAVFPRRYRISGGIIVQEDDGGNPGHPFFADSLLRG